MTPRGDNVIDLIERAADRARALPEYSFDEQDTPPTNPTINVNVHVDRESSQHEIHVDGPKSEAPIKKQLKITLAQAAAFIGLVLATALVGLVQNCHR